MLEILAGALECRQESDQLLSLDPVELQSEFVAWDGLCLFARWAIPSADVRLVQPVRIEHLLKACGRAVVEIVAPIPNTFQRRDLVVSSPLACLQSQDSIRPNRKWQQV